ncbi:hypothetical protein IQ258_24700, partial [Coleofasciculus sp. LEGE 07081]|nr:hypothetical protein [Coleofasciculus sp. LEGE 07081]
MRLVDFDKTLTLRQCSGDTLRLLRQWQGYCVGLGILSLLTLPYLATALREDFGVTLRQAQGGDAQSNASATTQPNNVVVVVNSNQDGEIQPDQGLTLREAIAIVNGELGVEQLSAAEKAQITPGNTTSRIEFNLPPDQTTIRLEEILPPLARPGLVVDGTTQPGYDATQSPTAEIAIPTPVVAIAPAPDRQILRGLTIVADNASVRGLSIYGFKTLRDATLSTPP